MGFKSNQLNADQVKALVISRIGFRPHRIEEDNSKYAKWWLYDFNIRNPKKYHENLLTDEFLQKSSISDHIKKLKLDELREIANKYRLDIANKKKSEIVEIILKSLPNKELELLNANNHMYIISNNGISLVESNSDCVRLYENKHNWNISMAEYAEYKQKLHAQATFRDIIWQILNDRLNSE